MALRSAPESRLACAWLEWNPEAADGVRTVEVLRLVLIVASVLATAAFVGGAGSSALESSDQPAAVTLSERRPTTILGLVYDQEEAELRRLDALTLRPSGRARLRGLEAGMHSFSPDRRTLVLASGRGGPRLRFIDTRTLRLQGSLDLPGLGWPSEFLWGSSSRLIVLLAGEEVRVVTVDPLARKVIGSQPLTGVTVAFDARAGRLAVLLAPSGSIGGSRLAVFDDAGGLVGIAPLPQVQAGSERIESSEDRYATRTRRPGVAVSPDGTRAVVVSAGNQIAEVKLDTLQVSSHELSQPISLLGRLQNWLEPTAQAKVVEGPYRDARWLGEHHIAVTGIDQRGLKDGKWAASAVGLRLIDTRNWSVRTVAEHVTGIVRVRDLLLAFGGNWPEGSTGTGLLAYNQGAEQRFHALGERPIGWIETAWPYGYVPHANGQGQRRDVIDLRSGRLLRTTSTRRPVSILGT